MPRFPPPNDIAYAIIDGEAIPVKDLPPDVWADFESKMMKNVGRVMSDYYSDRLARGLDIDI